MLPSYLMGYLQVCNVLVNLALCAALGLPQACNLICMYGQLRVAGRQLPLQLGYCALKPLVLMCEALEHQGLA